MNSKEAVKALKEIQKYTPKNMRLAAEWPKKWQVLIATILSAQTKDEKTIEICEKLFRKYPSLKALSKAPLQALKKEIKQINYHKTKAKHIKETAKMLANKKIPDKIEELLKLPGVGRKVANVFLAEAHKYQVIGVDTHVKRISQKMGWTKNKNPHKIEKDLEKLFPKKYWRSINYILVKFGRSIGKNRKKEDEIIRKINSKIYKNKNLK